MFVDQVSSGEVKNTSGLGLAVSTPARPEEDVIDDKHKSIFDWCKEGNMSRVRTMLQSADINAKDDMVGIFFLKS